MNVLTTVVSIIGILGTLSSIFFAYVALKKNNLNEEKIEGKTEGTLLVVMAKDTRDYRKN